MADLMRMLENYSRRAKQEEDKIAAITQQEELLRKELADAKALNGEKKQELAEAGAKCGELTSELQQKGSTVEACRAANDSTKQEVAAVQLQRQRLWHSLQELREGFIASCAQLDTQTHEVLHQLRATQSDGDLQGFSQDIDGLGDAHGSRLGAATAAAVGPGMLWPGLLAEDEPGAAEEEGPSSVLLCGGGLLLCEGEGSEQQQEDADMPEGMADAAPADGGLHMQS